MQCILSETRYPAVLVCSCFCTVIWLVLAGWLGGKGVMYLESLGHPTDIAYSWTRPAILAAGKGRGAMFLFLLFLYFQIFSSFISVPLIHIYYPQLLSLLSLFSLSLRDNTK